MRELYIVAYDICDPKRLRRTYRCLRGFGDPLQYSVFRCELTRRERLRLEAALLDIVHRDEDRVMLCRLGPVNPHTESRLETLGRAYADPQRHVVVI
jgi:CRISPR-associated protein Cas2